MRGQISFFGLVQPNPKPHWNQKSFKPLCFSLKYIICPVSNFFPHTHHAPHPSDLGQVQRSGLPAAWCTCTPYTSCVFWLGCDPKTHNNIPRERENTNMRPHLPGARQAQDRQLPRRGRGGRQELLRRGRTER